MDSFRPKSGFQLGRLTRTGEKRRLASEEVLDFGSAKWFQETYLAFHQNSELGRQIAGIMQEGKLVPDEVSIDLLKSAMLKNQASN